MSEKKSNRTLIIVSAILGIAGVAFLVWLLSLLLAAPHTEPVSPQPSSGAVVTEKDFKFLDVAITEDPQHEGYALINAKVTPLPDTQYGEWRVKNVDKKVVADGNIEPGGIITASQLPLTAENNSFTVEIRVNKSAELGGTYTEWVASDPVELTTSSGTPVEGVNTTAEPNPAYFDTAWAKGEASEENLREAITVAWGATQVSYQEDACSQPLNSATIVAGEIIPPGITDVPQPGPDGAPTTLKYDLPFYSETGATLTFYWCQKLEDIQN